MAAPDALGDILDRIANGEETEGDRQTLRQLLRAGNGQFVQLGKNIANIVDAQGDIQIGDRFYQGASAEAIQKAVRQVLEHFQLKDFPNPQKDWTQLLEQTKENLVAVPDQIGNTVFLPRQVELKAIETAFETSKVVVLLGSSGCGKTVIAKSWAEKELSSSQVIWWNARSFDVSDFQSFQSRLRLSHSLRELLATAPAPRAYVVIDGLDRIFSEAAFQNLSVLIQALQLNVETNPWRILIPCQLEEWNRVQMQLARANNLTAEWRIIPIKEPSIDDLDPVWKTFPALGRLRYQPQLQSLLLKPKVLDLLATKLSLGGSVDTTQWVGESNLIEWFWETEVSKQTNARVRAAFLKALGEKQADNLESETPTDTFSISDLVGLDSLIGDRLCREREERLSFYHDLYGDWARQRVLLGKTNTLQEYIKPRASSPLWHRAIRLYGLHLLEKNEDAQAWRSALISLYGDNNTPDSTSDLLLEAVIFAANPLPLLEHIWSELAANNGLLLRRLLIRFLHIATVPNPVILALASQLGSDLETTAATIQRIPYWPYWLPMLQFLHTHLADVTNLAPKQISEVADTWLRRGIENWPLRQEAAELALVTAEQVLHRKQANEFPYDREELCETVYHAAIAGADELPVRVANFALEACGRKEPITQEQETEEQSEVVIKRVIHDPVYGTYELELPDSTWTLIDDPERDIDPIIFRNFSEEFRDKKEEEPVICLDAPFQAVDPVFREVCLTTDALFPLIKKHPSVAREVSLALLIEVPTARTLLKQRSVIDRIYDKLEIARLKTWEYKPPLYNRGLFLFFLQNQPREGLETILRLVNFATERWVAREQEDNPTVPEVKINLASGECRLIGDYRVYYWFRNSPSCPKPIVIALMALEKWLYDEIDSNREIEQVVEFILQQSNSVAFAGLLSAVASKEPKLFLKSLKPFLGVLEFHRWEFLHRHDFDVRAWNLDSAWWGEGEESIKRAREWHSLPHREQGLDLWARILFLNEPEFRAFFDEVRSSWIAKLKTVQELSEPTNFLEELKTRYEITKEFLEKLITEYDIGNYSLENHSNHGEVWRFNPPEKLIARQEEFALANGDKQVLLFFPIKCEQIIDKGQPLPDNALPEFWDTLQNISKLVPPTDPDSTHNRIEDAICGGVTVLLKLHRNWLRQNPDKDEWCITQIVKTIFNPPQPRECDQPDSLISLNWEAFCASIIPVLWAESPDSPILRECVIRLALSYHYETVKILFSSAANYRSTLGDSFKQLQHFLLQWAVIRWKQDYSLFENDPNFNIEVWARQEAEAFIQKTTASTIPLLEEVAIKESPRVYITDTSFSRSKEKHSPGIDLSLIQSAYAWIPALEAATSQAERAEWIAFWKSALGCTLRMYGGETEDEEKFKIEPFWKWDEWIIEHITPLILQLHITENSKDYWQPILSLGRRASFLVERFLNEWFRHGLKSEPASEGFIREWRAMIEFVFSSPHWSRNSFYLEEAWCNLMGFSELISYMCMWNQAQKPTVRRMHDLYECWAHQHLIEPRCAVKFIIFLKQPAAEEILLDGLIWIEKAVNQASERFWRERDIESRLASLLEQSWHCHEARLRQRKDSFSAFKNLLKKLADFQNSQALEIQQRIVSMQ
jgi:energy-coupling factor transporter ATP-binding protein EcfA2